MLIAVRCEKEGKMIIEREGARQSWIKAPTRRERSKGPTKTQKV